MGTWGRPHGREMPSRPLPRQADSGQFIHESRAPSSSTRLSFLQPAGRGGMRTPVTPTRKGAPSVRSSVPP